MKRPSIYDAPAAQVVCSSQVPLKQMILPMSIICLGFAVMGFVGGTMEILNKHFQDVLSLNGVESACIQASFFGAYIIGPLTASGWLVRKYGYRKSLFVGHLVLSAGCICFWPSGHFASFGGFCGSLFLIGSGFALLDCASIPYIASIGPSQSSEIRVNIAFAVQSTFSVLALTLSSYIILAPVQANPHVSTASALLPVQYVYLGAGSAAIAIALVCLFSPLPEIHDDVLTAQLELTRTTTGWTDLPLRDQNNLWIAFVACCNFVGSQGAIAAFFINIAQATNPSLSSPAAARHLAIAQSVFAVSRFISTALMHFIKPRYLLLLANLLTLACLITAMTTTGVTSLTFLTLEFAAKACIHPTIVSLALRGLGRHTRRGSAILVSAVAAGMPFSLATGDLVDKLGGRMALWVPIVGVAMALMFSMNVNTCRSEFVDALQQSSLAVLPPLQRVEIEGTSVGGEDVGVQMDEKMEECCDGHTCEKGCVRMIEDVHAVAGH